MADKEEDRWMTVSETAALLRRTEETVRRQCRGRRLPSARDGVGPRAPWAVHRALAVEQLRLGLERPVMSGYGSLGLEAAVVAAGMHQSATRAAIDSEIERQLEQIQRADEAEEVMQSLTPEERLRLTVLDIAELDSIQSEEEFEASAQRLAARMRQSERLWNRALELRHELEDEEEE